MLAEEIPFVLDYLAVSFDRKPFDPTDDHDAAAMLVWSEDLADHDKGVCLRAIRSLRRAGTERWFPTHAQVEQAIQAELRREQLERPALVEDTGPPVSREEALAQVARLRQLTLRRPEGSDPQPIRASLPRLSVTAHDFGDHEFCGSECDQRPPVPTEAVADARRRLKEPSHDAHLMGDHQFCGADCVPVAATHAAGDHAFCAPDCQDAPNAETATEPEGAHT